MDRTIEKLWTEYLSDECYAIETSEERKLTKKALKLHERVANNNLNRTRPKRRKSALFLENSLAKSALSFVLFQKISSNFHRFG